MDGQNRTDELTDSARARAIRAQAETSRYYTFTDVRKNHMIIATFETENGGENTGTGGNGGDNDDTETGGNNGDSGNTGSSGNGGSGGNSGNAGTGGSGGGSDNTDTGNNSVINISIVDNAENSGGGPADNNNHSTGSEDANVIITNNSNGNNDAMNSSKNTEPKTGDTFHVGIYATMAMIVGLTYLLLYFADRKKGMTEERKQELVSSMLRWAKRGSRVREYMVLVPIFFLLCYYHSIGKSVDVELEKVPV